MPSFVGNYNLLAKLARGDIGDLYLARREGAGGFEKLVVIKRIHQQLTGDSALVDIFIDETHNAGSVDHPNVRQVYEFGRYGQHFYIALEYLEGVPFVKLLLARRENPLLASPRLIATILSQVCEGLNAAHANIRQDGTPLVHGNINPRGIFITGNGNAKVLDLDIVDMRSTLATRYGFVRRTFAYMSPEEIKGNAITPHSDIFSLGVVAWESITGKRLFKRASPQETKNAILNDEITDALRFNPRISGRLNEVIKQSLHRDPLGRYENARVFGQALLSAAHEEGPPLTSLSIAELIKRSFAPEIEAQERFVRRAREKNETETKPNAEFGNDYTRVDSQPAPDSPSSKKWDAPTQSDKPQSIAFTKRQLNQVTNVDPFDDLRIEFEDAMPEILEWQDTASIVLPQHLQDIDAVSAQLTPPPSNSPPEPKKDSTSPAALKKVDAKINSFSQPAQKATPPPVQRLVPPEGTFGETKSTLKSVQKKTSSNRVAWFAILLFFTTVLILLWALFKPTTTPILDIESIPKRSTPTTNTEPPTPTLAESPPPIVPEKQSETHDRDELPPSDPVVEPPIALQQGQLTIRAQPRAAVYQKRKKIGTTPILKKSLKSGSYRLRLLSSKRKKNKIIRVMIKPGKETKRNITW